MFPINSYKYLNSPPVMDRLPPVSGKPSGNPYLYSDIILCIKQNKDIYFECKKFKTYEDADQYFQNNYNLNNIQHSTIVPLSKLWPNYLKEKIIRYKISLSWRILLKE